MKHIRVYDRKPKGNDLLGSLGCLGMFAIVGCLFFWALTTTLDDMTRHDCEVNKIEAACRDLRK